MDDSNSPPEAPEEVLQPTAAPWRARRKRWQRRLMALGLGLFLPLVLVECGVRVAWSKIVHPSEAPLMEGATQISLGRALIEESIRGPGEAIRGWTTHPVYKTDEFRSLRVKPNARSEKTLPQVPPGGLTFTITTNALGLRGPVQPPAPAEALRVLCVGDSMTFGQGVNDEDTFPHQLEARLAEALGKPVRVFNAGVISLGQQEQLDIVSEFVAKLEPDIVLLQFTIANDVIDNWRWLDEPGRLKRRRDACGRLEFHILLTNPLARFSRAYRLAMWRWGRHAIKYRYMVEDVNLDRSARLLKGLADLTSQLNPHTRVGVVIAPSVVQVERGISESVLRTHRINDGIAQRCEAAGLAAIDLLPGLRETADEGASLYIPVDRHWNAEGCGAVADLLVPFCESLLE
jgi:lysophospholipase L1-like esterase